MVAGCKKNKSILGASILEVVMVLTILTILTPIVFKIAFKNSGDVKYFNMAQQIQNIEKNVAMYLSTEKSVLSTNFSEIKFTGDGVSSLATNVNNLLQDYQLWKSAKVYGKKVNDRLSAYVIINMQSYLASDIELKKVLGFAANTSDVGYIVKDKCGTCNVNTGCLCSIDGDWGIAYTTVVGGTVSGTPLYAVIHIDDNSLESSGAISSVYLYRTPMSTNSENTMSVVLDMNNNNIKNVGDVKAKSLGTSSSYVPVANFTNVNMEKALSATTIVANKNVSFGGNITVKNVFFDKPNNRFKELSLSNKSISHFKSQDSKTDYLVNPTISVPSTTLRKLTLVELVVGKLSSVASSKIVDSDLDPIPATITKDHIKKLKSVFDLSNLTTFSITNLYANIVNINKKLQVGNFTLTNGGILQNTSTNSWAGIKVKNIESPITSTLNMETILNNFDQAIKHLETKQ